MNSSNRVDIPVLDQSAKLAMLTISPTKTNENPLGNSSNINNKLFDSANSFAIGDLPPSKGTRDNSCH
jgi:hypothetical protein